MNTRGVARWIELVSWAFVALGAALPLMFHTSAFAAYRDSLAMWAYGKRMIPAADQELLGLMLGITGGSIAGKWIVHALIARGPLADGRAWARDLTLWGLALWFVVDSVASLRIGAAFQVWMINLVPLLLVGLPLLLAHTSFRPSGKSGSGTDFRSSRSATGLFDRDPTEPSRSGLRMDAPRACVLASLFGAATGIAIAFGADTPLFSLWFEGLDQAHFGGAGLPESSRRLASLYFGPIGGCTLAQFVMLAGFVRREASPRAAAAGLASILAWFTIDSGYGLAHRGLFNIALINVPALFVTLPPWAMLAARLRSRID